WNRLFVNDGNGNYTELTQQYGLFNNNQSWSSDFADIDNDGDFDVVTTNHDATIQLFENDGTGHYTEITAGSGLEVTGFLLQSIMRDFDNDGYVDLLIAGGSAYLFMNDGDNTFTPVPLPSAPKTLHSFGLGDLNNDGFIDIMASYGDGYVTADPGTPDRLWLNDGNANHWFAVNLEGTVSNRDAIGARTEIFGPWGVQVREVRAGESYGIVNSFTAHFGLGAVTTVDSVRITWPSGIVDVYDNLTADQAITVIENSCIAPIATITTSGAAVVCTGGAPLTLTADAGWNYSWNTGESTQSIEVIAGGSYTVSIDDGSGCTGMASIFVDQDPDETPTVSLDNVTEFCAGDNVTLTSSPAADYTWSTGETTQSIVVDQSGTYSVSVSGVCGPAASDDVVVDVLTSTLPVANNVILTAQGPATLTAAGDSIVWYDMAMGGSPVGYGSPWDTPFLTGPTSYWCSNVTSYGGGTAFGGATDNTVDGQYHSNGNNYLVFTANEPFAIRSVKVYADGAGPRPIALVDMSNGSTVAQGNFVLPDGESRVQLDFDVPAAGDYGLRIVSGNPQLWRDGL
ncbi:MAG: CRTAC1 family protein, partial [Flavobacteriales bacterium]|nr:CRTAC1 family protein [Flavobacteriales bacterium]